MSTKELNHDENFNLLIQKAINNQDLKKVTALIRNAIRRQIFIDLTLELTQAVTLGNKKIVQLIYLYHRKTPKLIPKILLSKKGEKHLSCMLFLLDNGFTVKPRDSDLQIFMHSLITDNDDIVFMKLMDHGINVNLVDDRTGYSLLHTACLANRMRIVKFLLKREADVNAKIQKNDGTVSEATVLMGKTALFIAIEAVNIPLIKVLLKNGANPNESWDILVSAIQKQHTEIIQILLEHGADVNITNIHGETPLHYCIMNYSQHSVDTFRSETAKMLLDNGADVNAKTSNGSTPLFIATENGNIQVMKVLINYKANIFISKNQNNLIHVAMGLNNYKILQMLWKLIPSHDYEKFVNAQNSQGQTPLHIGCRNANIEGVQLLLSSNINGNVKDNNGKTPLHIAIEAENPVIVKALLTKNVNIDILDKNGQTPLHYAAKINQNGMILIQYLINHGANINSVDLDGRVPLHFACGIKNIEVVDYLLKNNAKLNVQDKLRQTPLHWACNSTSKLKEDVKFFELLVKNGVYINCIDSCGNSPLHYAVTNGSVAITRLLLSTDVNIDVKNNKNETAVDYISKNMLSMFHVESDHDKIAKYLREHIIKLKIANLFVDEKNTKLAYKVKNNDAKVAIKHYEDCCKIELSRLKEKKCDGSYFTYHDILMKNFYNEGNFTFNNNVILSLKPAELDIDFPLYADILKSRINEAQMRHELFKF